LDGNADAASAPSASKKRRGVVVPEEKEEPAVAPAEAPPAPTPRRGAKRKTGATAEAPSAVPSSAAVVAGEPTASPLKRTVSLGAVKALSNLKMDAEYAVAVEEGAMETEDEPAGMKRGTAATNKGKAKKLAAEEAAPAEAAKEEKVAEREASPEPPAKKARTTPSAPAPAKGKRKPIGGPEEHMEMEAAPAPAGTPARTKGRRDGKADAEPVEPVEPEPARAVTPAGRTKQRKGATEPEAGSDVSPSSIESALRTSYVFTLSGVPSSARPQYERQITLLGGSVLSEEPIDYSLVTHIVLEEMRRSEKVLVGMCSGAWLLHKSYLDASVKAGVFLKEEKFQWVNLSPAKREEGKLADSMRNAIMHWRTSKQRPYQQWRAAFLDIEPQKEAVFRRLLMFGGGHADDSDRGVGITHVLIGTPSPVEFASKKNKGQWDAAVALLAHAAKNVKVVRQEFLVEWLVRAGDIEEKEFEVMTQKQIEAARSVQEKAGSQSTQAAEAAAAAKTQSAISKAESKVPEPAAPAASAGGALTQGEEEDQHADRTVKKSVRRKQKQ
jgi:hypothetical protein